MYGLNVYLNVLVFIRLRYNMSTNENANKAKCYRFIYIM